MTPDEQTTEIVPTQRWNFGVNEAARFVARTSWPWERVENRDEWALRLLHEPEFAEQEFAVAEARLLSAVTMLRARHAVLAAGKPPAQTDPKADQQTESVSTRTTVEEALAEYEAKGFTSLTAALMADALYGVRESRTDPAPPSRDDWCSHNAELTDNAGWCRHPDCAPYPPEQPGADGGAV